MHSANAQRWLTSPEQVVASGDLHWDALLQANLQAVPAKCCACSLWIITCRTAIVLGTAIPLGLFIIWNAVILGTITAPEAGMDKITDPLQELLATNGVVGPIVGAFSLLAIATSYIGFVLGLTDFLSDLLKLPSDRSRPLPYLLTLFPPLILSLLDPDIFFKALDFAGTYGVLVLFGVVPAAMSWSDRYTSSSVSSNLQQLVPGGRFTLSLVIGGAGYVIISELIQNLMIKTNIS
ncbi:Tryptophan/tyrosine permease [Cynara cardunculus var. scolymus]|uniref:Tryptophan/tyrosine permease n=1 Tax=Cynara cardunculus var. scolymus TaxID=59895 RepID=A0A103XBB8_CYNCS|nr:Tryptophan/tyrosine permease [Cynara cardunculus var. scolymus]